jgi:hypothetical protein
VGYFGMRTVVNMRGGMGCVAAMCPTVTAVADMCASVTSVPEMRCAVPGKAEGDRSQCEQSAKNEAREKDAFHGAVWLVVYSSSDGVSTEGTENPMN